MTQNIVNTKALSLSLQGAIQNLLACAMHLDEASKLALGGKPSRKVTATAISMATMTPVTPVLLPQAAELPPKRVLAPVENKVAGKPWKASTLAIQGIKPVVGQTFIWTNIKGGKSTWRVLTVSGNAVTAVKVG